MRHDGFSPQAVELCCYNLFGGKKLYSTSCTTEELGNITVNMSLMFPSDGSSKCDDDTFLNILDSFYCRVSILKKQL